MSTFLTVMTLIAAAILLAAWFPDATGAVYNAIKQVKVFALPALSIIGAAFLIGTNVTTAVLLGAVVAIILGISLYHGDNALGQTLRGLN